MEYKYVVQEGTGRTTTIYYSDLNNALSHLQYLVALGVEEIEFRRISKEEYERIKRKEI